jgi:hypothetical protein
MPSIMNLEISNHQVAVTMMGYTLKQTKQTACPNILLIVEKGARICGRFSPHTGKRFSVNCLFRDTVP